MMLAAITTAKTHQRSGFTVVVPGSGGASLSTAFAVIGGTVAD